LKKIKIDPSIQRAILNGNNSPPLEKDCRNQGGGGHIGDDCCEVQKIRDYGF
jgi:hypothetical protein